MGARNDANSLIFFAYWDRRRLPAVGRPACRRQERPKRPIINLVPIILLSLLPTGKVADNQIKLKLLVFDPVMTSGFIWFFSLGFRDSFRTLQ
jgi:hypothetical protein